jgi:hypothetical protein
MFQIAGEKVNKALQNRKLSPVFNLKINEAHFDSNHRRREQNIENSRMEDDNE